ncbi:hypothetical protein PILCRDRAFT_815975 [Piloderma croceum F 1598]|uniref:Uncharacterized protein n=1 Tax=Piloderma croceum (strain F 1598) TaxID=765440 RepID=A0A0C3FRY6_PILCF|nr:hypothetical protein PILCRDRAFT_815975 [Piloderma croceum F 1598]
MARPDAKSCILARKVIYHRLFGSENGNLTPIFTKFSIFRQFLAKIFYPDTKMSGLWCF